MKWLLKNGYAFDSATFAGAAEYGDIKFGVLRKIKCPWDASTFAKAVVSAEDFEFLEWLLLNDCPFDQTLLKGHVVDDDVAGWLVEHSLIASFVMEVLRN